MKKNCPKNFSVEVSVDEFLAVFRYPNKEVEGDWTFNESDYSREVNAVIRFMANRLKLKGLGGAERRYPSDTLQQGEGNRRRRRVRQIQLSHSQTRHGNRRKVRRSWSQELPQNEG